MALARRVAAAAAAVAGGAGGCRPHDRPPPPRCVHVGGLMQPAFTTRKVARRYQLEATSEAEGGAAWLQ